MVDSNLIILYNIYLLFRLIRHSLSAMPNYTPF
nr:MAG TPA: Protein of unknown function (DUF3951) [Caudoviricetes sp.]